MIHFGQFVVSLLSQSIWYSQSYRFDMDYLSDWWIGFNMYVPLQHIALTVFILCYCFSPA